MKIPQLHYISQGKSPEEHLTNIEKACILGAELVQLRLKNITNKEILDTAKKAREITNPFQTRLIINDYYKIAKEVNADGVHLGKEDTCPTLAREFLGESYIIGGTANTYEDCVNLISKKIDYIGLGPFRFTSTKENLSPIIGFNGYLTIIEELKSSIPIIGIGGITIEDITKLRTTGLHGIAVSGEITKNFNNINTFKKLIEPNINEQVWKI